MELAIEEVHLDLAKIEHGQEIVLFYFAGSHVLTAKATAGGIAIFAVGEVKRPRSAFRFAVMKDALPFTLGINARYVSTVVFDAGAYHVYFLGEA